MSAIATKSRKKRESEFVRPIPAPTYPERLVDLRTSINEIWKGICENEPRNIQLDACREAITRCMDLADWVDAFELEKTALREQLLVAAERLKGQPGRIY